MIQRSKRCEYNTQDENANPKSKPYNNTIIYTPSKG